MSQQARWDPAILHHMFQRTLNGALDLMRPRAAYAQAPVADAGPDQALLKTQPLGSTVTLDGTSSSSPDGAPLTYEWHGPFLPTPGATPVVVIPEGRYTLSLLVNDGFTTSPPATVTTEVVPCFALSARPKPGKVQLTWPSQGVGVVYTIYRASASTPSNFIKIGETTSDFATFLDTSVVNEMTYLYVVYAMSQSSPCFSAVTSAYPTASRSRVNAAPVIYSTPITHGTEGLSYTYDVNATNPNRNVLSYSVMMGPAGMVIDTNTGLTTWTPPTAGTFDATVAVNDGLGGTAQQTFTIDVASLAGPNTPPLAHAGPHQTVLVGAAVPLDGSGATDVDGDPLTYQWSFTSVPPGSTAALSDPTLVNPTFEVDVAGTYVAQLRVNDGKVDSAPDTVVIATTNSAPVAHAGPNQTVLVGDTVTLDGSGATDVDGDSLTYQWTLESVPEGSTAVLLNPTTVMPTFEVDVAGT